MIGESWTINSLESVGQMVLRLKAFGSIGKMSMMKRAPKLWRFWFCVEHVLLAVTTAVFQVGNKLIRPPYFLKKEKPNQNSCWKRTVERKHLEEMPVQFQSCLQDIITYIFQDVILCFIRQLRNEIIPLNMDSRPPLWSMVIIMYDFASWDSILEIHLIHWSFLWC